MKVYGTEIQEHIIDHAISSVNSPNGFTYRQLEDALVNYGVERRGAVASRCADRVLQRLRRRCDIAFTDGVWMVAS